MNSIIELRKKELTTHINQLISDVEYFINNKKRNDHSISISQYLEFNEDKLEYVKNKLHKIKDSFNPQADNYTSFENCIESLKILLSEINKIQERAENKLSNLQFLLPIKILTTIIWSILYWGIWIVYWDWLENWRYLTLIFTFWYPLCYPFLVMLFLFEEDPHSFEFLRKIFTKLLLEE
ncbi:MAG: hypothetical protein KKA84_16205 [Bacteroidetes bacterium]|nr:hypothetical protein [Bacteroidota bacterium]